ncbi:methylated-DNA--[protein]-cysteine S-methyltransferase [Staphylococcus coagulans]|uniref:methylated-DNA--[protein]-cysteine S-methyltransferase n=1 Tax=Staphylococcus coagulans TaxID=74706 RepID=UPI001BE590E2|nr:methylated-DNA--[protein]-cysteine S-methyltransferase [Staphylococcus coagulans]MBT2814933.1 methylated-DNA--[protein]-cysteine S-methyltransferase [Staphylococcus coagulans]MBT2817349.1 methylated-DNA--[protein]-cysteine S-methyltransferase [Staphylococcus coagulans]MBT2838029.1 methylated-DNA--[protein]-cysteine S-methyltransferase [Staphylococcus coagulans]MBT2842571.1 methylated-DNA--[protein]-cysteine S-methyltransferase [Staphylococcus coagulans]MBT2849161.1 methylated-DNA--[protein]
MSYYYQHLHTPLGVMTAVVNAHDKLVGLAFNDSKDYQTLLNKLNGQHKLIHRSQHDLINQLAHELECYFHGYCQSFKTPISFEIGTPFQQKVWGTLQQLSYGNKVSYGEIAQMMGHPKSTRAVASAIGLNPLSIIIPCHRVIRKDGQLGGFNSGLNRKIRLLTLEGHLNE